MSNEPTLIPLRMTLQLCPGIRGGWIIGVKEIHIVGIITTSIVFSSRASAAMEYGRRLAHMTNSKLWRIIAANGTGFAVYSTLEWCGDIANLYKIPEGRIE